MYAFRCNLKEESKPLNGIKFKVSCDKYPKMAGSMPNNYSQEGSEYCTLGLSHWYKFQSVSNLERTIFKGGLDLLIVAKKSNKRCYHGNVLNMICYQSLGYGQR